jgi:hypothetical protein
MNEPLVSSALENPVIDELVEFPGFTTYTESNCLFCKKIKLDEKKIVFLGHWEFSPLMPTIVTSLIIASYIFCLVVIDKTLSKGFEIFIGILMSILAFMYVFVYYRVIIVGPGYFPFYYSGIKRGTIANIPKDVNGVNYSPAGIISNVEQHLYATTNEKPNRCIVARSARRIVIKPDHMCTWTASWIGKRNAKIFIQFNFYGALYCFIYIILGIIGIVRLWKVPGSTAKIIFTVSFCSISIFFFVWHLLNLISLIENMINGQTTWEIWNKISRSMFDKGRENNISDVFGNKRTIVSWLCPTSPFDGLAEEELVRNYANYYV